MLLVLLMFQPLLSSNFSCSLLFHRKTYLRNWKLMSHFWETVFEGHRSSFLAIHRSQPVSTQMRALYLHPPCSLALFSSLSLERFCLRLITTRGATCFMVAWCFTFIVSHQSRASQSQAASIHYCRFVWVATARRSSPTRYTNPWRILWNLMGNANNCHRHQNST